MDQKKKDRIAAEIAIKYARIAKSYLKFHHPEVIKASGIERVKVVGNKNCRISITLNV